MKYVIIGNSAAGIGAVEGIRQIDKLGEITVITNEPYHTYSRPLISYLLLGKTDLQRMKYRDDDFYIKNNVNLRASSTVIKINEIENYVTINDGSKIPYDKLLVATGSSAFVPPFEGLNHVKNKFTFMTLDDANALNKAIDMNSKVLIVGAGLIGLKCAEGIHQKVKSITVVDLSSRILSSILDDTGAKMVQNHMEAQNISFKMSQKVKSFTKNAATLENGEEIPFDVLVLAVGVRPNIELLKGVTEIEKGIIINTKCQTKNENIYAAGDCTQSEDVSSGDHKIMALLPNAYMQGECAGINMAGGDAAFNKAIPMNAIGFFGLHMITAGNYIGDAYIQEDGKTYKKLFYSNNKLNGYILIGNVEKAGIYTNLIRERTALGTLDFELICKKPGLMAFTKEYRNTKLGGMINEN
ncbi:FAD-dependent oxidoreductase [Paludicola sp. MB14-C6]|uniref:NAD(P)/FAD-dependent oxidoreductase n=1 Tax=Paludihabitans sp. MB14-C6 TaxID=3070656 RepID=UPI0027DC242C|nr:FAD-dependent oxidoreductase [Paludicola sp. MB14-C6]WMJ24432.1 FAD-dependent oxidoreductase [Paludicola sp. MB14-C6]